MQHNYSAWWRKFNHRMISGSLKAKSNCVSVKVSGRRSSSFTCLWRDWQLWQLITATTTTTETKPQTLTRRQHQAKEGRHDKGPLFLPECSALARSCVNVGEESNKRRRRRSEMISRLQLLRGRSSAPRRLCRRPSDEETPDCLSGGWRAVPLAVLLAALLAILLGPGCCRRFSNWGCRWRLAPVQTCRNKHRHRKFTSIWVFLLLIS